MLSVSKVTFQINKKKVLDEISLNVTPGSFYALLGRHEAGKSTLLRLCAGLLQTKQGLISVNGMNIALRENKKALFRLMGYMGPQDGYFPRLQVMEYLEVCAHAQGLFGLSARERCMEVLQLGGLERKAEQLVEEQPLGIRRELSFLRAILHRPRLLLIDDPFEGMELEQKLAMEELFAILAEEETTIVMTTQSLSEAAQLCSEIGILEKGRIISQGSLSQIMRQARSEAVIYIRVTDSPEKAARILGEEELVKTISREGNHLVIRFAGGIKEESQLLEKLVRNDVHVYSFYRGQSSLENLLEMEANGEKKRYEQI